VGNNEKCAGYMNTYNTYSPFPSVTDCKLRKVNIDFHGMIAFGGVK
jgi:hypothetical protein